jgi:hypothetical protein
LDHSASVSTLRRDPGFESISLQRRLLSSEPGFLQICRASGRSPRYDEARVRNSGGRIAAQIGIGRAEPPTKVVNMPQ